ncbi:MAG: ABC transporter permease [Euryarchaeota archaeon]|nr:ABC transporter permease [Euryarchaeota archaeon]
MNPRRVHSTTVMHIRTFSREKAALFFTFFFPIMLMVLFGLIFQNTGNVDYTIHIQDQDGSYWSQNLTGTMGKVKGITVQRVDPDADSARYMKDNDVNFLLIIPRGYNDTINSRLSGVPDTKLNLTIKYDPSDSAAQVKFQLVGGVIGYLNKMLSGQNDTLIMNPQSVISRNFSYIEFFIPGLIGLTVMTSAVFGSIGDENEYRQKGIIRKLSTTPITRGEWILSTMLYQLFLAAISTTLVLGVGYIVFGAALFINAYLPVVVVATAFAFSGVGMLFGRLAKDAQSAAALANVITFPMMFLSGSFFPLEQMPDFLQSFARVLPLYYVNQGLRESMLFENMAAAGQATAVIAVFAVIIFALGVYLTTWKQD